MSCNHPLKGFVIRPRSPTQPAEIKVTGYDVDHIYQTAAGKPWLSAGSANTAYEYRTKRDFIEIPCGKCIECRLAYARQWADRCMLEASYYDSNYFLTLTYNPEHLVVNEYLNYETGEFGTASTLVKEDLQKFWKRLRKQTGQHIRYFACGEYGETTARPHYHAIVYNLDIPDLEFYKINEQNQILYKSKFLDSIWQKGFVTIGEVTWDSCCYVSRYVTKKLKGQDSVFYTDHNILPEFVVMSRRPGIGRQFYDDNADTIYNLDYVSIKTDKGGHNVRPSRYFDKLREQSHPDDMFSIKSDRLENALSLTRLKMEQTDQSYSEMLRHEESAKIAKIRALRRNAI